MSIEVSLFRDNELTAPKADNRQYVEVGPLRCMAGGFLPEVTVAYETWGKLNATRSNAILVCHALSGDSHATGWWSALVGPGRPIDTERYFVVASNVLGGCQGTTGPSSLHPEDGRPYGSRFPVLTIRDLVEVQIRLIDSLGIRELHAVAGGSMGGMQALQWTVQAPGRVKKAFVTACGAAHNAMQIGFNEAARQAIRRDAKWRGGDYPLSDPPSNGLAVARMIGHISFLSEAAFDSKFGRRFQGKADPSYHSGVEFEVESYLNYQGDKFTSRFDANSLLVLTRAIDYFELNSLAGSLSEYLFVGYTSDWLYPTHQIERLNGLAEAAGCPSRFYNLELPFGHDAFLLDGELQGAKLREFLGNGAS